MNTPWKLKRAEDKDHLQMTGFAVVTLQGHTEVLKSSLGGMWCLPRHRVKDFLASHTQRESGELCRTHIKCVY